MTSTPSFAAPILAHVWQLRSFSADTLDTLAANATRETAAKGDVVIREGEAGIDAYVVIDGRLEVQIAGKSGPLPIAVLGPGELFGEVAIVAGAERRTASVVALTPVTLLRLDGASFAQAIDDDNARPELKAAAERMAVGRFIKSATLLGDLSPGAVARLSERVQIRHASPGEIIIRQGDPGDECYLIRHGELEVVDASGDAERHLAKLRTGMLFGEAALLTGAPRNATVRVISDAELLVLRRDDVLEAMASEGALAEHLVALMQARSRPRRKPGVELHDRTTADGTTIWTLKDPARGTYFRLSREGAFVWNHLDGVHTLRDITMDLFLEYKTLAPDVVMDVVRHLAREEFIDLERLDTTAPARSRHRRFVEAVFRVMEYTFSLNGCDRFFNALYQSVGRFAFTRAGIIVTLVLAAGGFAAFISMAQRSAATLLHAATVARVGFFMIPLAAVAIILHELGHGVAAKAAGARVDRVGFGWFWFRVMLFVDTSDAWLATREQRMLVDAGGILVNLVLAGAAGYLALFAPSLTVAAVAWVFALWSYIAVLRNLNPLLEYDGYYLLMDAMERPNLRGKSLGWIATGLWPALRSGASLRGHRFELLYALGAVVYIGAISAWTLFIYRYTAQGWVARIVPPDAVPYFGRVFAVVVGGLALFRLCNDIWTERARLKAHARHVLKKG